MEGRQGTGYFKKLLAMGRTWDLYLLKYPAGSSIPLHRDPAANFEHYRLNLVLWGPQTFFVPSDQKVIADLGRLQLFRSDTTDHAVKRSDRTRYVLSLGWLR